MLHALHEAEGMVMGVLVDPTLAAEAQSLCQSTRFETTFNRIERPFSRGFVTGAKVLALRYGQGLGLRRTAAGRQLKLGPSALLELAGLGLRVFAGFLHRQSHEPRVLGMHGIDIAAARCVVVKSRGHFRAGFEECFPDG